MPNMAFSMDKTPVKSPLLQRRESIKARTSPTVVTPTRTVKKPSRLRKTPQADRFIPNRGGMDVDIANFNLSGWKRRKTPEKTAGTPCQSKENYQRQLADTFLTEGVNEQTSRILSFKQNPMRTQGTIFDTKPSDSGSSDTSAVTYRRISQKAEKVLDAPGLLDDYYLNILDWSKENVIAIALGTAVHMLDVTTDTTMQLMEVQNGDDVTSLSWAPDARHIAVGLSSNVIEIWDTTRSRKVRTLTGHTARVGSLAWRNSDTTLSSGSLDSTIINHDVRMREHITSCMTSHSSEVCGLKWSPSGRQLASGANDNLLHIWDAAGGSSASSGCANYLYRMAQHRAAVKALAWCPFQSNLLASGAGHSDPSIKFWNTQTGSCLNSIQARSQVCALQWSDTQREILSSHGCTTNEQLCLWKYPTMVRTAELTGHATRAGNLAKSPDGSTVASAGDDEKVCMWKIFDSSYKSDKNKKEVPRSSLQLAASIR